MPAQRNATRAASLILLALIGCEPGIGQGVLTTIAGTDWLFPANGLPATNAPLTPGFGLAVISDRKGNSYFADQGNQMVMRIGPAGVVDVIAGNGLPLDSGDGGLAINAGLFFPLAIAIDSSDNLYIAEFGGNIRKFSPGGNITTIAGTGENGFSGDGGPAIQAQLNSPYGIAVDAGGSIYVADTVNQRIRKITPDGIIRTIAGGGSSTRDGVAATSARLLQPQRIVLDSAGNIYFADLSDRLVRKIDTSGIITTVAGGGSGLSDGIPATSALLIPSGIAVDGGGNLYVVDSAFHRVRRVDPQGLISTIAGSGSAGFAGDGGPAIRASLHFGPYSTLTVDAGGNLLVGDDFNGRIRRITPDGLITTIAGNGLFHFSGNGGPATSATLDLPSGVTGAQDGTIYFTEAFVNRIRRISVDGTISVVAGTGALGYAGDGGPATNATLAYPQVLTIAPNGSLVFSEGVNCVIRAIDPNGIISTVAGTGICEFNGDLRPAASTSFRGPQGVDYDDDGDLLISDTSNNRIRGIVASGQYAGQVLTIAGNGTAGYSGDGGLAPYTAQINQPTGLRAHGNGLYFCDTGNHVIRYVDFTTFVITTVAGNGVAGSNGDGGPATKASLRTPNALVFDPQGNMYIADAAAAVIRKVDTAGVISTVAGGGTIPIGDGLRPLDAFIGGPSSLFLRPNGNIVFTDVYYNRVREILGDPPSFTANPQSLAFTATAGSAELSQSVELQGSISGIPFSVSTDAPNWLSAAVDQGRMPASVGITVNPSLVPAGTYTGNVKITAANATPGTMSIPVSLTATAAGQPSLSAIPASLTYPYAKGAAAVSRSITVSNTGGGSLTFSLDAKATSGGTWLQTSVASGTLGPFGSTVVTITADPARSGPGTYSGVLTLASVNPAQSIVVPVTMTITAVSQTIVIPQTGLSFFAVEGGGLPPPQQIDILNSGSGQMPWSVSTSTQSGGGWLSVFPENGQTDAASSIVPQVRINVNTRGLSAGTYFGTVQVSSPGAVNNPQVVSVVFTVLPPGSNPGPIIQPAGMIFTAVAGARPPGSQTITVQSTSASPVSFTSGIVIGNGDTVFQTLPPNGTVTQAQPAQIIIQPVTSGLAPGIYRGSLTIAFSDGNTRIVALLLVVTPGTNTAVSSATRNPAGRDVSGPCVPTTLAPVFTTILTGSTIPAGYPGVLEVRVVDDCANPIDTGGVVVAFTNGDAPLGLTPAKSGRWIATWTPARVPSPMTLTATASVPAQNLRGQVRVTVGGQPGASPPVISQDGIVNAASFAAAAPIAPGSLVAVFGSQLAQGSTAATVTPLPVNLADATVVIAGARAPLLFASDGQLNAVVPFGVPINSAQQVISSRGLALSVPQPVVIAAAAPGVFTFGDNQGVVVDVEPSSGSQYVVNPARPAKPGHVLVIYCTGLGETDPPVPTGQAAPANPLSRAVNDVAVTIGGLPAEVLFAGLTPTQVGLYQVNVKIPSGLTPGPRLPLVVSAAGQVSAPVDIAVQ